MSEKITIELGNVQKTLLLPLVGRAIETQKEKPLLIDRNAVEIVEKIDYDLSKITQNISEISQLGWIIRSLLIDNKIKNYINEHPEAIIVNIGCGLDTTFERIDNGKIVWYDLDLPDVIKLRSQFIQESERRKFIARSFLDYEWLQQIQQCENVLFIIAGVLYYFEEDQIKEIFSKIADNFPDSEMVFDATSPIGVKMANKMVIKNSGMDKKSYLKWGIKSAKKLESFDKRIKVLDEVVFFKKMKKGIKVETKIGAFLSDVFRMQYIIHLKFS